MFTRIHQNNERAYFPKIADENKYLCILHKNNISLLSYQVAIE